MRYTIPRKDGGVAIMTTVTDDVDPTAELAKWSPEMLALVDPSGIKPVADVPADRTFRNAWKPDLSTDMPKAREIWRNKIRAARKPKLEALDAEYIRADETGDHIRKQVIVVEKQALRDLPQNPVIELAQTPEDLKTLWPEILGVPPV